MSKNISTGTSTGTSKATKSRKAEKDARAAAMVAEILKDAPAAKPTKANHTSKAKAAKAAKELATIKAKANGTKAPKVAKPSPTAIIRSLIAADPAFACDEDAIAAELAKAGFAAVPRSTIKTVKADFLGCLKALQACGRINKLH